MANTMTKVAMVEELKNAGIILKNVKKMTRTEVEEKYNEYKNNTQKEEENMNQNTVFTPATENTENTNKEDKNMTTTTETTAPKTLTKKAQTLIADIQAITPAYGDRLQTLSTIELTALRRMLKDRARQLEKVRKAEEAAEAKRNAEPKQTVAQKLATEAEQMVGYYELVTNAKGHLYIKESGKTLAKVYTNRKGVTMMPRTDVVDTLPDKGWEYHPGWASKFALVLPDMAAVWAVLDEYWLAKEEEVAE